MNSKLDINYIINNVMFTIKEHFNNKFISPTLKEYLYLIATGMIINYGDNYIEDIYKTIFSINFLDLPRYRNVLDSSLYYNNPVSNNYLEKEEKIDINKEKYNLIYKEIDGSCIKTLEYLTYQINYIMFSKKKKSNIKDNIRFMISSFSSKLIFKSIKKDNIVSNIFNTIQAEAIVKIILKLNINVIKNKEFKRILKRLELVDIGTYQIEGLSLLANLFKPLYRDDKLKELIDSYDNTELIKKELDGVLGKNTYKETISMLEVLDELIKKDSNINNNYYELSNYYVYIRNNIINRYIRIKGV